MKESFYFVANWKMYFAYHEAIAFAKKYRSNFIELTEKSASNIILCPSFTALYAIKNIFEKTNIFIGGQDCSHTKAGAFTGQESAQSLSELLCTHCIIGHSERRQYCSESNASVAEKYQQLIQHAITPIICIGESASEHEQNETFSVLEKQLIEVFTIAKKTTNAKPITPFVAYEPVWAIGTGKVPTKSHLDKTFSRIKELTSKEFLFSDCKLLYGGSVKSTNARDLALTSNIDGFLIGGASLDFQEFKNIVNYTFDVIS